MPNVQFSLTTEDFVLLYEKGLPLGLSEGRLAKAICLAWLKGVTPSAANILTLAGDKPREKKRREML